MGSMRDAFKKANLISNKDAKRLAHEERVHRTEVGREGVEKERAERQRQLEEAKAVEREATRRGQDELERERKAAIERAACLQLVADEARRPSGAHARYYFELEDGTLPFLEVGEQDARQLQAGMLSIVRLSTNGGHEYGTIATVHARRIAQVFPERVVHAPRGVVR